MSESERRRGTKRKPNKKFSELFGRDIDVLKDVYIESEDLEGCEISAYRVTADYGDDYVTSVNDGYTIMPGVY